MPQYVPFASNYIDRSNSLGFQWEFFCFRCGNGYRSTFQAVSANAADAGGFAARKAASFIPVVGAFIGDKASDLMSDKAKDAAEQRAVAEVLPLFAQCSRCGRWRCRAVCWNLQANLCIDCAPRQQVGMPQLEYGAPVYGPPGPYAPQGYAPQGYAPQAFGPQGGSSPAFGAPLPAPPPQPPQPGYAPQPPYSGQYAAPAQPNYYATPAAPSQPYYPNAAPQPQMAPPPNVYGSYAGAAPGPMPGQYTTPVARPRRSVLGCSVMLLLAIILVIVVFFMLTIVLMAPK